jgi:hypothetical protein
MSEFTFLDLVKARIGEKVHVKLKARDYATHLFDVVGDFCVFKLGSTRHYVHYSQVSFYCNEKEIKDLETKAEAISKGE